MAGEGFYIGGKIRIFPSDFIVEEVWKDRICGINYSFLTRIKDHFSVRMQDEKDYLHFTLVKHNWDNIRALNYIGSQIHVSLKRFGISGTKDKRAFTAQRISLWRGEIRVMKNLKLPDMILKDFEYSDKRINLGDAIGNKFTIIIRDIDKFNHDHIVETLHRFKEQVMTKGIPNYYGPQRLRGNVEVGKAIKCGNLKLAVEIIVKKVKPFLEEGDVNKIPKVFWYEKKMLQHLTNHSNDYAGALRKIPKKIRRFYTHSLQSHTFNQKLQQFTIMDEVPETITVKGFDTPKMPELKTIPITRRSYFVAKDFKILYIAPEAVKIKFTLSKGDYASTLLSHLTDVK
jgi:TruD family tRNA pseudouridine synthase